jgi:hypothetical protein
VTSQLGRLKYEEARDDLINFHKVNGRDTEKMEARIAKHLPSSTTPTATPARSALAMRWPIKLPARCSVADRITKTAAAHGCETAVDGSCDGRGLPNDAE